MSNNATVFDQVMEMLQPAQNFQPSTARTLYQNAGFKIANYLIGFPAYESMFGKNGRSFCFNGTLEDKAKIVADKAIIIDALWPRAASRLAKTAMASAMASNMPNVEYEKQLVHLGALIRLVDRGASYAMFCAGRGGIGKSHAIFTELERLGHTDGEGYFKITGSASPSGIYRALYEHRNSILVFDDCDGALNDQDARNLIKAATDTKKKRKLAWMKASKHLIPADEWQDEMFDDGFLPKSFDFTGRVIFISNLQIDRLDPDGALRTRALMIGINPTDDEVLTFMRKIVNKIPLEDGLTLSPDERLEVVDYIGESEGDELNLRKLVRGLNIRAAAEESDAGDWRELMIYA